MVLGFRFRSLLSFSRSVMSEGLLSVMQDAGEFFVEWNCPVNCRTLQFLAPAKQMLATSLITNIQWFYKFPKFS